MPDEIKSRPEEVTCVNQIATEPTELLQATESEDEETHAAQEITAAMEPAMEQVIQTLSHAERSSCACTGPCRGRDCWPATPARSRWPAVARTRPSPRGVALMTCWASVVTYLASVVTYCTMFEINKHALSAKTQNTCLYSQRPS